MRHVVWRMCLATSLPSMLVAQLPLEPRDRATPRATWIAPDGLAPDDAVVFLARRTVTLATVPAHAVVHVSADQRYRLFVNGVSVATGPQRADVLHWRYETVDLAPHLRPGPNVVSAIVWNWGPRRPVAQHSLRTGFLLQGDDSSTARQLNTGHEWRLLVDSAYRFVDNAPGEIRGYFVAAPAESFEAARHPWGWERPGFDDATWGAPRVRSRVARLGDANFGDGDDWQLQPRDIPPLEETPQRFATVRRSEGVTVADDFVRGDAGVTIPPHTTATLLLDQGRTTNAYLDLTTSGGTGATITLTTAEALVDAQGEKGHRDSVRGRTIHGLQDLFRPDGADRRTMQTLSWRAFRYVEVTVRTSETSLQLHDVHSVFTGYPFTERGAFHSDAAWIDDVWRLNWNGARLGAMETYMDTPYYEQLQYIGDTRIQSLISLYVAGDDRLVRQAILQFDASRIADGLTASRYPSAQRQVIPPFSLIYVAMVRDYAMLRDDPAFVRQRLPGIRGVLDWYARYIDTTGMPTRIPYWNYVDWTPRWDRGVPPQADTGHSATIALLYASALQHAAALERKVGTPALGDEYRARAEAVIAATRRHTWDAQRQLFRDAIDTAAFSQHTNVLAILTGAVPRAERRAVMQRVLRDTSLAPAGYYFGFYVLEALREAGLGDRYIEQLAPWRGMLALGLTSAPEKPEPTRSDTHAWAAHPNYGLLATVLGVRPASPGFRTVQIAPALGPLRRVHGRVPHPRGEIDVELVREGARGVRGVVTLPLGVPGEFVWRGRRVPLRGGRQVVRF